MYFSFRSVLDLDSVSVGEVTIYDKDGNPLLSENIEIKKVEISGEQVGDFDESDSAALLPPQAN